MTKTAQAIPELKEVLLALLLEKKKVKALEEQLEGKTQEAVEFRAEASERRQPPAAPPQIESEELQNLRLELANVKEKYEQDRSLFKAEKQEMAVRLETQARLMKKAQDELAQQKALSEHLNSLSNTREASDAGRLQELEKLQAREAGLQADVKEKSDLLQKQGERLSALSVELDAVKKSYEETLRLNQRHKQAMEKLAALIREKDRKIAELQPFEYSLKKSIDSKNEIESALEKEKHSVKTLEREKEDLRAAALESRQHTEKLEKVIYFLRKRSEEARLEADELRDRFQEAQADIESLNKRLAQFENGHDQFEERLKAEETLKQELHEELKAIHYQFDLLKKRALETAKQLEEQKAESVQSGETIHALQKEKQHLESLLKQKDADVAKLAKETALIKQSLIKGLRELKEIENRYLESVGEKAAAFTKYRQLQQYADKQSDEIAAFKAQILQLHEKESSLNLSFASELEETEQRYKEEIHNLQEEHRKSTLHFEDKLADLQKQLHQSSEKKTALEREIEEFNRGLSECKDQLKIHEEDKRKLQESLRSAVKLNEEKETQLNAAQQHLAKKVRENTQLNDKFEEAKAHLEELQKSEAEWKIQHQELQAVLDAKLENEKDLQTQLQEAVKRVEEQNKQHEEKYSRIFEKWQAEQGRLKELEKMEAKYLQLQQLLSNLGNVLDAGMPSRASAGMPENSFFPDPKQSGPVSAPAQPAPPQFGASTPADEIEDMAVSSPPPSGPYQNLFDMPKPGNRQKQNLFD